MVKDKENSKIIGQVTWITYLNFGTFLQAFALQKTIEKLGYESYIIDDKKIINQNSRGLKSLIWKFLSKCYYWTQRVTNKKPRRYYYNKFSDEHLLIDSKWRNLQGLSQSYNKFICGSDQIWSPLLPTQSGGFYYASFATKEKTKIAYAPSFGSNSYSKEYAELVRPWLNEFQYLSARELRGSQIISEITGIENIPVLIDPTLLLSSEEWVKFERNNRSMDIHISRPYLLAYFLTPNEMYLKKAREIANSRNLELVMFDNLKWNHDKGSIIINGGPMEFLTTIAHASYIVTDSFHGTIFAILFKRPFLTVKRFKDDEVSNQNSRIENLFAMLGIEDNFLDEKKLESLPTAPDWDNLEKILVEKRKEAFQYLKESIS